MLIVFALYYAFNVTHMRVAGCMHLTTSTMESQIMPLPITGLKDANIPEAEGPRSKLSMLEPQPT